MRLVLSATILASVLVMAANAHAQQQPEPSYVYGGSTQNTTPLYNATGNNRGQAGSSSLYNSGQNLQILPMQQMITGQNAPSYRYGGQQGAQPYTNYGTTSLNDQNFTGSLSPEQAMRIREQRNAQAYAYQQQYLEQLRQRDMNALAAQQQVVDVTGQIQDGQQVLTAQGQQRPQGPVAKPRVIYNQLNDPLVEPPRLFNLDR